MVYPICVSKSFCSHAKHTEIVLSVEKCPLWTSTSIRRCRRELRNSTEKRICIKRSANQALGGTVFGWWHLFRLAFRLAFRYIWDSFRLTKSINIFQKNLSSSQAICQQSVFWTLNLTKENRRKILYVTPAFTLTDFATGAKLRTWKRNSSKIKKNTFSFDSKHGRWMNYFANYFARTKLMRWVKL